MVRMAFTVRRRRTRWPSASESIVVSCRLGRKRRRVLLLAWLTLLPVSTPLPVMLQRRAMARSSSDKIKTGGNKMPPEQAVVLVEHQGAVKQEACDDQVFE